MRWQKAVYTAGRLPSSYPCLTGDRGGAQLMTIKQDMNREKCDSSEHQPVPLQLNIEPFSISTFQTTVTNLFIYKIEVFSLWHILQRQQQILHVNSLNSGRMKACKICILVNVGNSTIPNQRLMLKYNPGAAAPFINCPHSNSRVWNEFHPCVQPESHNLLQCCTFQFQNHIPNIFLCQFPQRLANF